jgi:hypothetical protein
MKGVIVNCFEDMVVTKFGKDRWEKSLEEAGLDNSSMILASSDVSDAQVINLIGVVCKNLGISLEQVADAFGHHWVYVYSQIEYGRYYQAHKTAKELLLCTDMIHSAYTKTIKNAKPPRFYYEWKNNDNTLIMHYISQRGLIDFAVGIIKAVGEYYKENINVIKLGPTLVQVDF